MSVFEPVTLDQLTVFLAVVESGSFSKAGKQIGRVQSAVSHAIAALESTLGLTLFDRSRRAPVLTDAGRRLAGEARLVLAQARGFHQLAEELRGGVEAEVEMALDLLFPREVLVAALAEFHAAFPLVAVRVHAGVLDDAIAHVRDGTAAFGICNLLESAPDPLVASLLTEVLLVPVCAPTHPLARLPGPQSMSDLRGATQIVLAERTPVDMMDATADQGVLATRTWRVTDLDTKRALLVAGVGWGSMPLSLVEDDLARGALARLSPAPWPDGQRIRLHSVVRDDRPLGPAARGFLDTLARQLWSVEDRPREASSVTG